MTAHAVYSLVVGEVGFSRDKFLYSLKWWEIRAIIDGYVRRDRLTKEILRLNAYIAYFSFQKNEQRLKPYQWLTLPWEKELLTEGMFSKEELAEIDRLLFNKGTGT